MKRLVAFVVRAVVVLETWGWKYPPVSWLQHGAITAVFGDHAPLIAVAYTAREVRQHQDHGTEGWKQWGDRVMDVLATWLVVAWLLLR